MESRLGDPVFGPLTRRPIVAFVGLAFGISWGGLRMGIDPEPESL